MRCRRLAFTRWVTALLQAGLATGSFRWCNIFRSRSSYRENLTPDTAGCTYDALWHLQPPTPVASPDSITSAALGLRVEDVSNLTTPAAVQEIPMLRPAEDEMNSYSLVEPDLTPRPAY